MIRTAWWLYDHFTAGIACCHQVKFRRGSRLWPLSSRTVEMRGRSKAGPPGRRCMHRHSTGSELAKLAVSHPARPST
jgi:hypothetical protein